jgi:hypothetical protein
MTTKDSCRSSVNSLDSLQELPLVASKFHLSIKDSRLNCQLTSTTISKLEGQAIKSMEEPQVQEIRAIVRETTIITQVEEGV